MKGVDTCHYSGWWGIEPCVCFSPPAGKRSSPAAASAGLYHDLPDLADAAGQSPAAPLSPPVSHQLRRSRLRRRH